MNITPLEHRLTGSRRGRFVLELFKNSAQFPIANILLEMLMEGPFYYLLAPDLYAIIFAGCVQAFFLSSWETTPKPRRFWGNLIAPLVYTVIELILEGPRFWSRPHHIAYWIFSFVIGILQTLRPRLGGWMGDVMLIVEHITRASILLTMYIIFEALTDTRFTDFAGFMADPTHQFVVLAIPLLGLVAGVAELTAQRYLNLLRQTLAQLRLYSEWLLGRELLNRIVADPNALTMIRQERTVMFVDIRGFTHWSESRTPEEVVAMLDRYYRAVEEVMTTGGAIKFKFAADEAMAIFATPHGAAATALKLQSQIVALLATHDLGAGVGIHTGNVVEGLLGSAGVKFYDVIGDTVNTAKRIESNAGKGEVWISEFTKNALKDEVKVGEPREITVKGKEGMLRVYPIH
mgnify:FL=1